MKGPHFAGAELEKLSHVSLPDRRKNGQESRVESGEGTSEGKPVEVSFRKGCLGSKPCYFHTVWTPGFPQITGGEVLYLKLETEGKTMHTQMRHVVEQKSEVSTGVSLVCSVSCKSNRQYYNGGKESRNLLFAAALSIHFVRMG